MRLIAEKRPGELPLDFRQTEGVKNTRTTPIWNDDGLPLTLPFFPHSSGSVLN